MYRYPKSTEYNEQCALWEWAKLSKTIYPYFFHIPNEHQDDKERARLSRTGLRKGVPDNFIALARGPYHGMFIELKSEKGALSDDQRKWIEVLRQSGYHAVIARGWVEAVKEIGKYLKLSEVSPWRDQNTGTN